MLAGGFIKVKQTQNIGLQNRPERPFDRYTTEMNNGIYPGDHGIDCYSISQISQYDFLGLASKSKIIAVGQA